MKFSGEKNVLDGTFGLSIVRCADSRPLKLERSRGHAPLGGDVPRRATGGVDTLADIGRQVMIATPATTALHEKALRGR